MWQCVGTPKSRYVDFVYATLESGSHASSRRASQTTFVACPALSLGPPPCSHAVSPESSLDQQIIEGCTNCQFAIKVVWSRVQVPPSPQAPSVVRPWRRGDSAARSAAGRGDRLELAVRLMPAPDATRSNATSAGKREVGRGGGSARTGEMNGGGGVDAVNPLTMNYPQQQQQEHEEEELQSSPSSPPLPLPPLNVVADITRIKFTGGAHPPWQQQQQQQQWQQKDHHYRQPTQKRAGQPFSGSSTGRGRDSSSLPGGGSTRSPSSASGVGTTESPRGDSPRPNSAQWWWKQMQRQEEEKRQKNKKQKQKPWQKPHAVLPK